jgi:hypothetical protein
LPSSKTQVDKKLRIDGSEVGGRCASVAIIAHDDGIA